MMEERAILAWAIVAGIILPLVHAFCGWLTLNMGWQRGQLRDGLLHGMLLGPAGLLTALLLHRERRATQALQLAYSKSTRDQYHVLFFTAWGLFYVGIGLVYGACGYAVLSPPGVRFPQVLLYIAATAIALGYSAFFYARPPASWIPPLGDCAEYEADDPGYSAALRFSHQRYRYTARILFLKVAFYPLVVLAGVAGLISLLFLRDIIRDGGSLPDVVLLLAFVLSTFGAIYCAWRRPREEDARDQHDIDHAEDDQGWIPVMPVELRQQLWGAKYRYQRLHRRWRYLRVVKRLSLACCVVSVLVGGSILNVYQTLAGAVPLVAGLALSGLLYLFTRNMDLVEIEGDLQDTAEEYKEADQRAAAIANAYLEEREMVEFAFRHDEDAASLVSRRINLPGPAPWVEQPPAGGPGAGSADGTLAEASPPPAAMPAPGGLAATAEPQEEQLPSATRIVANPRRTELKASSNVFFRGALSCLLITITLARYGDKVALLGVLSILAAAVLGVIGAVLLVQANALPAEVVLPVAPTAREAPGAPGPQEGGGWPVPAPLQAAGDDGGSEVLREQALREAQLAQAAQEEALQRRQRMAYEGMQLDVRLAQRGMAIACLFYPSLALVLFFYGNYMYRGVQPTSNELVGSIIVLVCTVPAFIRLWMGNTPLYLRRVQIEVEHAEDEQSRMIAGNKYRIMVWRRTARNRLRLLWACCGLLLATLALGACWQAGVFHSSHPVPLAAWLSCAAVCAALAAYLAYTFRQALGQVQIWRERWLHRAKEQQLQRYSRVMEMRKQAEVVEQHDGYEVRYTPQELSSQELARWVELDFMDYGRRDPVEYWLDRSKSLLWTAGWVLLGVSPICRALPAAPAVQSCLTASILVMFTAGGLIWLGRMWRLRALREQR